MDRQRLSRLVLTIIAVAVTGCTVNPVTGKSDFVMVGEAQEVALGEQNYLPMQQAQGGVYDIDPQLTEYVQSVGSRLATVSDRRLPYEFVVLNNSVPNAWALPGGKIAINRGLLTELSSESELAAVLGHEIVHAAARHSAKQMSRDVLIQGVVLATAAMAGDGNYGDLVVGGASAGAQLLNSTYSRGAELEADRYGMDYMSRAGYSSIGAITLQKTFVRLNKDRKSNWLNGLFVSHPPSQERVDANTVTAKSLPPGGDIGVDSFRVAMRKTREIKAAYAAYDEGRMALEDHRPRDALRFANEAIELYPREAHFYALRGDIRHIGGNSESAIPDYDTAIERRDGYFYYYLQRGLARQELGMSEEAATDLERSIELLPTSPAYYVLGDIETERGNLEAAVNHYRIVAKAGGHYGNLAEHKLLTVDLARNPGAYVRFRCIESPGGRLIVGVFNTTRRPMQNILVEVAYTDSSGNPATQQKTARGPVPPNQVTRIRFGLSVDRIYDCPVTIRAAEFTD